MHTFYRIVQLSTGFYCPQYRRGIGDWHTYRRKDESIQCATWEEAYTILEKHANPAILAVRFVGTF